MRYCNRAMARVVVVHVRPAGKGRLERTDALAHLKVRYGTRPRCGAPGNEITEGFVEHDGPVTCLWCARLR